ncbi:MAG: 4Fe-4S dicluster domain-containing protein, partial [Rhizobiales bacterium]|nr:4Fe-4S dicluster domain-containing protein [Hyphomicrobiales bacterium]
MQTSFSLAQLADPDIKEADAILRRCVHCGFCTATCPTYLELGNELDSPRGRIYLIKDMLENDKPASSEVALHIDRCLSCYACMTTCPSGVDYMHLVDQARVRIEKTYRRPLHDRIVRGLLAAILPYPARFRAALLAAKLGRPFAAILERFGQPGARLAAMLYLAATSRPAPRRSPPRLPPPSPGTGEAESERSSEPGEGGAAGLDVRHPHLVADATRPRPSRERTEAARGRVALLTGCAQSVLDPGINEAAIRLLNRFGIEVVLPAGEGCCGAIVHHMGRDDQGLALARHNIDVWTREIEGQGLDAILVTASGCGTSVKDYGHAFRLQPGYAAKAARVSALALDITEYLARLDLPPAEQSAGMIVAYHSACSMQHGQRVTVQPKMLLENAGFSVRDIPEGHIC